MSQTEQEHLRTQLERRIDDYLKRYLQADYFSAADSTALNATIDQALSEVLEPMQRLVFLPGKRWRPALCLLHALLLSGQEWEERLQSTEYRELLGPLAAMVELVHNATLIADDIEDGGQLRRGIPALHLAAPAGYGMGRALNACNWAYFAVARLLRPILQTQSQQAKPALHGLEALYMDAMHQLHLGQALDIGWHRQNHYIPRMDEYLYMAKLKTGVLAGFAAEVGALAGAELSRTRLHTMPTAQAKAYRELWQKIGCAFQVLDDLLNLTLGNSGKLRGDDWLEGKKSFPICIFIQGNPQKEQERRAFVAALQQKARQAAVEQGPDSSQNHNSQTLQATLDDILHAFQNAEGGHQALLDSADWLEGELETCSVLAAKLYKEPESIRQAPADYLLHLIANLKKQARLCGASLKSLIF